MVGLFNSNSDRPWKRHANRYATPSDRVRLMSLLFVLGLCTHPLIRLLQKITPPSVKARMAKTRAAFIGPSIATDDPYPIHAWNMYEPLSGTEMAYQLCDQRPKPRLRFVSWAVVKLT